MKLLTGISLSNGGSETTSILLKAIRAIYGLGQLCSEDSYDDTERLKGS